MGRGLIFIGVLLLVMMLVFRQSPIITQTPVADIPPPTDEWFQAEVVNNPLPVLVDFTATWCPPCKIIGEQLVQLEEEFGEKLAIVKIDVDERPGLSEHYQVSGIPRLMVMKKGQIVGDQTGAGSYDDLKKLVEKHL